MKGTRSGSLSHSAWIFLATLATCASGCDRPVTPSISLHEASASIEHRVEGAVRRPRQTMVSLMDLNRPLETEPRSGFQQLPLEGAGFYHFRGRDAVGTDAWGRPSTIECIQAAGQRWSTEHPDRPRFGVGDISRRLGGQFLPHRSHRDGRDVDIRPMSRLGERKAHVGNGNYASDWTSDLVAILIDTCDVQVIYFNDRRLIRQFSKVRRSRGHNDHLHVRIRDRKPSSQAKDTPSRGTASLVKR